MAKFLVCVPFFFCIINLFIASWKREAKAIPGWIMAVVGWAGTLFLLGR